MSPQMRFLEYIDFFQTTHYFFRHGLCNRFLDFSIDTKERFFVERLDGLKECHQGNF